MDIKPVVPAPPPTPVRKTAPHDGRARDGRRQPPEDRPRRDGQRPDPHIDTYA